jgi:hypothetical protein
MSAEFQRRPGNVIAPCRYAGNLSARSDLEDDSGVSGFAARSLAPDLEQVAAWLQTLGRTDAHSPLLWSGAKEMARNADSVEPRIHAPAPDIDHDLGRPIRFGAVPRRLDQAC